MKYLNTFYIWLLLAFGASHAAAQTPTDIQYERDMAKLAKTPNVKIDTVTTLKGYHTYPMGEYVETTDQIRLTHFVEKYDSDAERLVYILKAKKYIQNTFAHEQTHRRNSKLYRRAIFKDIIENTKFFIYDEISARLAEIIKFRAQMADQYRRNGKLILTDLLGNEITAMPSSFNQNISGKKLYRRNFDTEYFLNNYYVYYIYLINNPNVLTKPVTHGEIDYILMTALHSMDNNHSKYIERLSNPHIKYPSYFYFKRLADIKDYVYYDLFPDSTTHIRGTSLEQLALEWVEMGFDIDQPPPAYDAMRRAARRCADMFELDPRHPILFEQLVHELFTFDGIDYIDACTPNARMAMEMRINKYMNKIIKAWGKDIAEIEYLNSMIEAYWADFNNQPRPSLQTPTIEIIYNGGKRSR